MSENLINVLKNCHHIIGVLALGRGFSYDPSDMVGLSNRIAVEVAQLESHLTQRAPDAPKRGAKVVKSKSKKVVKPARR
jgi:hypothetical protein